VPKADDAAAILNVRMAPTIVVLGKEGELLYKSGRPSADNTEQFTRIRAIIDSALIAEPSGEESKARPAAAEGQAVESDGATKVGRPAKGDPQEGLTAGSPAQGAPAAEHAWRSGPDEGWRVRRRRALSPALSRRGRERGTEPARPGRLMRP
jgi:hypothetical protein